MAKGISLHIGLNSVDPNHYEGWSGVLNACEADASDMHAIATSKGFKTHSLLTTKATRKAVIEQLGTFSKDLDSGDILFLSYSGHGGQVADDNDDEVDGADETWCLYDGQLIDDELFVALGKFKQGVRIVVLSDSCHSGTVLKAVVPGTIVPVVAGPAKRGMPPDVALRTYRKHQAFYDGIQRDIPKDAIHDVKASALLISGCQDNQTSSDGQFNGLFTANLLRVWKRGGYKGSYRSFHKAILRRMPDDQSPNYFKVGLTNPAFEKQTPFTV